MKTLKPVQRIEEGRSQLSRYFTVLVKTKLFFTEPRNTLNLLYYTHFDKRFNFS